MSSGRTGLILRQWVVRNGCEVTAYQAESYETPEVMTSVTERLRGFVFPNEEQAKLCESRMSEHDWELKKKYWMYYFKYHVDPPNIFTSSPRNAFGVPFPDSPRMALTVLAIIIICLVYFT